MQTDNTLPNLPALDAILARHNHSPTALLQILRDVQTIDGWLPPATITHVAARLGLPRARVEGVAGFYSFLYLAPAGRYTVRFADNITDQMAGNAELVEQLCKSLWLERGKTSEDGLVSVDMTSCTGMCDQGPAMLVNGHAIARLTHERIDVIAELIRAHTSLDAWPAELFVIEDNIRRPGALLGAHLAPGEALRAAIAQGAEATLEAIKRSNLRGRGGAGFAAGLKWEGCRGDAVKERYVVCNADEGEPGTFKDRVLLARYADLVFEGMSLCAYVIGAQHGFLYLRGEYEHLLAPLRETLARRRAENLLGTSILGERGFDFDIDIHIGAGAYVCGEGSALLESLEGKRGIPRSRPPRLASKGYLLRPTVVNNVETLCAAAVIATKGADWYRNIGTARSTGTTLLSVSGDCPRPGIYEYPFGVTVREVLADCGASDTQAVQISGPSGTCIDASEFDRRLAFEDLATAGAFIVFDSTRDMFEVARTYTHFFAHESCGFCTPCRVGTTLLKHTMDKLADGKGSQHDLNRILRLKALMRAASHCGLGETAVNPIADTLKRFRPSYERRLQSPDFEPAFDLDGALARARAMTGRDDAGAHIGDEK